MSPVVYTGEEETRIQGEGAFCREENGTGDGETEMVRGGCVSFYESAHADGKGQVERKKVAMP